ncbi:hypothetical protein ACFPJ1_39360 [Kribbella qitaiheensis]
MPITRPAPAGEVTWAALHARPTYQAMSPICETAAEKIQPCTR